MLAAPRRRAPAAVDRTRAAVAVMVAIAGFSAALALRARFDPWLMTAGAAAVSIALAGWALGRARLAQLFEVSPRDAVIAVALGIFLVAATHAAYWVVPFAFRHEIRVLYGAIDGGIPRPVLAVITAGVVVAEELVWRAAALELLRPRQGPRAAGVVAVVLYVVPQVIGGAWLLMLAAVGLGALFTVQRLVTGRLVAPLLTHAVWSVAIFVVVPLT